MREADGLRVSATQSLNGRVVRVYRATPAGVDALADGRRVVRELAAEVLVRARPGRGDDV